MQISCNNQNQIPFSYQNNLMTPQMCEDEKVQKSLRFEAEKERLKTNETCVRDQNRAVIQLWRSEEKAAIDVRKKSELERMRTMESIEKAKNLADVQSVRELQKTEVQIAKNGRIFISREAFGVNKTQKIDFWVGEKSCLLYCKEKRERILRVFFL